MEQALLNNIHKIQIEMMKELHCICKENQLRYTVLCGSLLGAVRHKGFIPWDDDMDIGLVREDYDKLLEILKNKPIKDCFLQDFSTDEHYYQPYAKLLKENTVYIEKFRMGCKAKNGIFIDIFPLDYIKKPGLLSSKVKRLFSRLITFAIWEKEECHMERSGVKKIINLISVIIGVLPKKTLIYMQNSLIVRKKRTEYVASMFSSNYDTNKLYFELKDFDNMIEFEFENIVVNGPRNWKDNLMRLYKNYNQLPPVEKRTSGHDVEIIEL